MRLFLKLLGCLSLGLVIPSQAQIEPTVAKQTNSLVVATMATIKPDNSARKIAFAQRVREYSESRNIKGMESLFQELQSTWPTKDPALYLDTMLDLVVALQDESFNRDINKTGLLHAGQYAAVALETVPMTLGLKERFLELLRPESLPGEFTDSASFAKSRKQRASLWLKTYQDLNAAMDRNFDPQKAPAYGGARAILLPDFSKIDGPAYRAGRQICHQTDPPARDPNIDLVQQAAHLTEWEEKLPSYVISSTNKLVRLAGTLTAKNMRDLDYYLTVTLKLVQEQTQMELDQRRKAEAFEFQRNLRVYRDSLLASMRSFLLKAYSQKPANRAELQELLLTYTQDEGLTALILSALPEPASL